jgi:hypothetical protein
LTPVFDYTTNGQNIVVGERRALVTDASGAVTFSGVVTGNYTISLIGDFKPTKVPILASGTGLLNAVDLISASLVTPDNLASYSRRQIDAKIAAISGGGSADLSSAVLLTGNQTVSGIKTFASQILASNGIANPNGYWSIDGGNATFSGNVTANQVSAYKVSNPGDGSCYFDIAQGQIVRNNIAIIDAEQASLADGNGTAVLDWSTKTLLGQWRTESIWHPDETTWLIEANGYGTFSKLFTRDTEGADGGLFIRNDDSSDIRLGNESFTSTLTVNAPVKIQGAMVLSYNSEFDVKSIYDINGGQGISFFEQGIALGASSESFGSNTLTIPNTYDRVDINGPISTSISIVSANNLIRYSTTLISGANVTGTLPNSPKDGVSFTIKMATNHTGTLKAAGSFTIDGSNTRTLAGQYKFLTVQALANNWFVTASG